MFKSRNFLEKFKNAFINEKGSTLLTVLVLLLIFAVIGSTVLVTTMNNLAVSQRMSEYEDTYYIAEANAQFALTFLKEEITQYYMSLQKISATKKWEYQNAMENFYPSIVDGIISNPNKVDAKQFEPLDFSDQGVTCTVTFSVDVNTPLPTSGYGEEGQTVRFLIESIAESENTRRVVNAVLEVDDPDVSWEMTTAPPMTDMRMLIGNEIVLTDDAQSGEYNAIFCRGSAMVAYSFGPQFLENHQEFLNTFTYDFSNAVPSMLKWDLQYDKFPVHNAFATFESLFEASTPGTDTHNSFYDWQTRDFTTQTVPYTIQDYAPATYSNADIIDSHTKEKDVDFYFTQQDQYDTRYTTRYEGTAADPVRVYAVNNLHLSGYKNLKNCYIYAEGNVNIRISGYIENTIIISNQGYVYIDCYYISNDDHMLIKGYYDVNIHVNSGAQINKVVARSKYGELSVETDAYASYTKATMTSCYLYTNPEDRDAMIYLENIYAFKSYCNAGKDLVLRNSSGKQSSFYAYGSSDWDLQQAYWYNYLWHRNRCYNDYMQYYCNGYFHRYYRGIIVITELPDKAYVNHLTENAYVNCDFVTAETIFLADPYYSISYGNQTVQLEKCRIIADREVLIEDVIMKQCYVFAGIRGYENEQDIYYRYGVPKLYVVRGIHMRVDHTHNEIRDCVFYSRGRMMYSQHTPESYGYQISEHGKVRVYDSFFYSIHNFEYNGISTSQGLDTTIMRNRSDLCNNMIIMTERNLGPHEYSPSVANDVLFIGGNLDLDPEQPNYSGVLHKLIGEEGLRGIGDCYEVQCDKLYDNYFEQLLTEEEFEREIPGFGDVFVYEDIYEKTEAGNGG